MKGREIEEWEKEEDEYDGLVKYDIQVLNLVVDLTMLSFKKI